MLTAIQIHSYAHEIIRAQSSRSLGVWRRPLARASASVKSLKSFALTFTRRRHQYHYTCLQASAFKARNKQARHVIDYLLANPAANAVSSSLFLSLSLSSIYLSIYLPIYLTSSLSLPLYSSVTEFRLRIYRTMRYSRSSESFSPLAYQSLCLRTYIHIRRRKTY